MSDIHYEPPESTYGDTLLAYQAFARPSVSVRIDPDPLGDVNCIIRLLCNGRRIRSVLHPKINPGQTIRLVCDEGGYSIGELFDLQHRIWDTRGMGGAQPEIPEVQRPGWRVEVDEKTVLQVLNSELRPPPPPPPKIPWRRRARRAVSRRAQAAVDAIAKRLGYHRDGDCEDGW